MEWPVYPTAGSVNPMAEKPLAYWLALVDGLVEQKFSAALDEHGVTRTQWRLLGALAGGASTPADLQRALADAPADAESESPADELAELVDSGWVTVDGSYAITERGVGAYERLAEVVDELRDQLTTGLTDAEQAATAVALERMALNLGWAGTAE